MVCTGKINFSLPTDILNNVFEGERKQCPAELNDFCLGLCSLLEDLMQKQCMHLRNFATLPTCLTKSKREREILAYQLSKLYLNIYAVNIIWLAGGSVFMVLWLAKGFKQLWAVSFVWNRKQFCPSFYSFLKQWNVKIWWECIQVHIRSLWLFPWC